MNTSQAQPPRGLPFWCHLCRCGVNAELNQQSGEYECHLCGNSFVENVNQSHESTSQLLSYTASDPPQTASVGTSTTGPNTNPFLSSMENALLRSLGGLEESGNGVTPANMMDNWTRLLSPPPVVPGAPAGTATSTTTTATPGGEWLRSDYFGHPPSTRTMAPGAPRSSGGGPSTQPGAAPIRFYVNRDSGGPGSIWSILQPLLGGIESGFMGMGGTTTLGDYAFGDMSTILQQLMLADPNRHGPPPASASAVQSLEVHRVSQAQVDLCWECPVCKDVFAVNEETRRMPCDHFFHPDCLLTWLKQHNNCPVCRLELPTDDPDYERNRAHRNANNSTTTSTSSRTPASGAR